MPPFPERAQTAQNLSDSVFSQLVAYSRQCSHKVYPLHIGDTYRDPPQAAWVETLNLAAHPALHSYPPPHGDPALLEAVAHHIAQKGAKRSLDQIQILSGATSGLSIVVNALVNPGEEVIIPSPFWPLIRGIVAARGAIPVEVPFWTHLDDPNFDAEAALERAVTSKTAALYLNDPHNPTGVVLDAAQREAFMRVAEKHNLWLLADEAYEELCFDECTRMPVWTDEATAERTIAVHTFSKSYAMAGARVGFAHGPKKAMQAIRAVHTFQMYATARPMQQSALRALQHGDTWLQETRTLYSTAAGIASKITRSMKPAAGTFLFFDTQPFWKADETMETFLKRCVDKGVLLTPGSASGKDYTNWARLCFTCLPPEELNAALEGLKQALES